MSLDEIRDLARAASSTGDYGPLDDALCRAIPTADAETIWALLCVDGMGDIHGEAQLPTPVVSAILQTGLDRRDARVLGLGVRMAHFHCASLICGDIRKAKGQRAIADLQDALRAVWDEVDDRLRVTMLHGFAVADVITDVDRARVAALVNADDPEVVGLALMVHSVVGDADRDTLLAARLDDPSPIVRLMAAISLAREDGARPLSDANLAALRTAYRNPVPLPAWWSFVWIDSPETAEDLAERMIEEAGHRVDG